MSRGLKINNPGNIRKSGDKFKGEIIPSNDTAFKTFEAMPYGYRAMFKILFTYIRNGYNTINKIIYRWAPPGDNNPTESYIEFIVERSGINRDSLIMTNDKTRLKMIVAQMASFEQGNYLPDTAQIESGWNMANNIIEEIKEVVKKKGGYGLGALLLVGLGTFLILKK